MKKQKYIYLISTWIIALLMFFTAIGPLVNKNAMLAANKQIDHWGFPHFFHIEWEIAKILGAIALAVPFFTKRIKEFAYNGFIILLVSAIITHIINHDSFGFTGAAIFFLVVLLISYRYYIILMKEKSKLV